MDIDRATEDRIVKEFFTSAAEEFEGRFPFRDPVRGDSGEFNVVTPVGPATLAPLLIKPAALPSADLGAFCDAVAAAILKKRPANPGEGGQAALLLYVQENDFDLHGAGLALIRRQVFDGETIFDHVISYWPRLSGPGVIEILSPFARELLPADSVVATLRKMKLAPGTASARGR